MTNEEFIRTCSTEELVKDMQGKIRTCWDCGYLRAKEGKHHLCGDRCVAVEENAKKWLEMEHVEVPEEEGEAKCENSYYSPSFGKS